ncbi:hypothetical protein B0T25DRAFT_300403 [Lasiosphaeria hispida]|uniref:Uncharacterized protein n=1 Tax=Lasiosphaeria hispida TaxID=260671 RepID=A0AAJ0H8R1_9PEZI|nr:hypothetical protein B0T25DRAFT_300403 [Lasiosphaeria hispida]
MRGRRHAACRPCGCLPRINIPKLPRPDKQHTAKSQLLGPLVMTVVNFPVQSSPHLGLDNLPIGPKVLATSFLFGSKLTHRPTTTVQVRHYGGSANTLHPGMTRLHDVGSDSDDGGAPEVLICRGRTQFVSVFGHPSCYQGSKIDGSLLQPSHGPSASTACILSSDAVCLVSSGSAAGLADVAWASAAAREIGSTLRMRGWGFAI